MALEMWIANETRIWGFPRVQAFLTHIVNSRVMGAEDVEDDPFEIHGFLSGSVDHFNFLPNGNWFRTFSLLK